jgi:hypothetical protein
MELVAGSMEVFGKPAANMCERLTPLFLCRAGTTPRGRSAWQKPPRHSTVLGICSISWRHRHVLPFVHRHLLDSPPCALTTQARDPPLCLSNPTKGFQRFAAVSWCRRALKKHNSTKGFHSFVAGCQCRRVFKRHMTRIWTFCIYMYH